MNRKPHYHVSGYAGAGHPAVARGRAAVGDLLVRTWHIGESSKDAEVAAWRSRMSRGEVSKIVIEDFDDRVVETITS